MSARVIPAAVAALLLLLIGAVTAARSAVPQADKILFVRADAATGLSALYSVRPDGTGLRKVFAGLRSGGSADDLEVARWSPDGKRIAFAYLDDGIYVANADGTSVRRLAAGDVQSLSWAPDSRRLVFARVDRSVEHLYVETVGSGAARRLLGVAVGDANASDPAWSPDGRTIAYVVAGGPLSNMQIRVVGSNGSGKRKVVAGRLLVTPDWSVDSKWLGYLSVSNVGAFDLMVAGRDGKGQRRLTQTGAVAYGPRWAPRGDALAYVIFLDAGPTQVVEQQSLTTPAKRIDDDDSADHGPTIAWSPDATRIAFYRRAGIDTDTEQGLYLKTVGESGFTKIVDGPARPLDWR